MIPATMGELEKMGVLRPPQSPFSSLVWPMEKSNGTWPMTTDYRKLKKLFPAPSMLYCEVLTGAVIFLYHCVPDPQNVE